MGLQDGARASWSKQKSGRTRRTIARSWRRGCCGSSTAEGSWKRTWVAHVSIGCLQRAELIVGLDRARTQDMRAAILDGVRIPTHAIVRPTGSLQTVTRRGAVEITACRMHNAFLWTPCHCRTVGNQARQPACANFDEGKT